VQESKAAAVVSHARAVAAAVKATQVQDRQRLLAKLQLQQSRADARRNGARVPPEDAADAADVDVDVDVDVDDDSDDGVDADDGQGSEGRDGASADATSAPSSTGSGATPASSSSAGSFTFPIQPVSPPRRVPLDAPLSASSPATNRLSLMSKGRLPMSPGEIAVEVAARLDAAIANKRSIDSLRRAQLKSSQVRTVRMSWPRSALLLH
jgi:hypothetical protein